MRAAVNHSGRIEGTLSSSDSPDEGLPLCGGGSAPAMCVFGARSTFTRVAARTFAKSLKRSVSPKAFYGFVTSADTQAASGSDDQSPSGNHTHGNSKPSRRTPRRHNEHKGSGEVWPWRLGFPSCSSCRCGEKGLSSASRTSIETTAPMRAGLGTGGRGSNRAAFGREPQKDGSA